MRQGRFLFLALLFTAPILAFAADKPTPSTSVAKATPSAQEMVFKTFKDAYSAGNQALKDRKFTEAVADYESAEELANTAKAKSQAANAQGWTLIKARKLDEAKKVLGRAVEEDDSNKVALKNLGVVSYRLYEYGLAGVEELKSAIKNLEASGENPEQLDRAKGDLTREESYAQVTPVPEPDMTKMGYKDLCALGDKLQVEGRFEGALKAFAQAEKSSISPNSKASAANRQGKALLDARKPGEAVPHFERAVEYRPEDKQLKVFLNSLGLAYWSVYDSGKGTADDLKKAVDAFYKANSIDASFHSENIAMALSELKEVDPEAAKAYVIKEEPTPDGDKVPGTATPPVKDENDDK
ncbi:MAG TPA: tetratricopeptide repeat protein [bacterium]|nr:tetratricopeptide repeat protein [bacterium]